MKSIIFTRKYTSSCKLRPILNERAVTLRNIFSSPTTHYPPNLHYLCNAKRNERLFLQMKK